MAILELNPFKWARKPAQVAAVGIDELREQSSSERTVKSPAGLNAEAAPITLPVSSAQPPAAQPAPQQERTTMSGFFLKIKTAFENLFKKSPTFIHYAIAFVTYAAPIVLGIEAFADPALVSPTQAVIARIQTGLATLYALAQEGTASGATLATTLAALKTDLSSLEATAGIKDAATIAKIATLLAEIQAIESLIPATPASPAVPAT